MNMLHIVLIVLIALVLLATLIYLIYRDGFKGVLIFIGWIFLELFATPFLFGVIEFLLNVFGVCLTFFSLDDSFTLIFPVTVFLISGLIVSISSLLIFFIDDIDD